MHWLNKDQGKEQKEQMKVGFSLTIFFSEKTRHLFLNCETFTSFD